MAHIKTKDQFFKVRNRCAEMKFDFIKALERGDMNEIIRMDKRRCRYVKLCKRFRRKMKKAGIRL